MLINKNRFEGWGRTLSREGALIGTRAPDQIIFYPKIKDRIHALSKNPLTSLKLWDTQSCTMHLCLLQHLPFPLWTDNQLLLSFEWFNNSLTFNFLPTSIVAMHEPLSICLLSSFLLLLQICQCPVTFCCIESLDGFCVNIS